MKLTIEAGTLYADNIFFSYAGAGNGRDSIQPGRYPVTTQFSHAHGQELPNAAGLGWIGPAISRDAGECDIVLGRVRGGDGVLPCASHVSRLLAILETAESRGSAVELVVMP